MFDCALMATAETKPNYKKILIEESESIWWKGFNIWDDLTLFRNDELIFYVCTHEEFGYLYLPKSYPNKINLPGSVNFDKYDNYRIKGIELNLNTL